MARLVSVQQEIATTELTGVELMNSICLHAQSFTPGQGAVVELVEKDEMVYTAASGTAQAHIGFRLKRDGSFSGLCVTTGQVLRCDDSETDDRVDRAACRRVNVRAMICVPLIYRGSVIGVLKIMASEPNAFAERDAQILRLMSGLLSSSLGREAALAEKTQALEQLHAREAELRRTSQTLQTLIDSSPLAILTLDEEGRLTLWNPACEKMFGWKASDVMGQPVPFVPEENRAEANRFIEHILSTREPVFRDADRLCKNGEWIRTSTAAMPLIDENNKVIGLMAVLSDITHQERARVELERAKEKAELSNKELSALTRAKSDFVANISHEIRTPINGVIGMTTLLLDTQLNSEQQQFAEYIKTSANTLLELINDVLDFSKMEAGKTVLEHIEFDLERVLTDVERTVYFAVKSKDLAYSSVLSKNVPRGWMGDPTRVRQILLNLVSNAVKFTQVGEVSVDAACTATGLKISVRDSGVGIAPEHLGSLFESFSQADSSTTRRFGGTGLGLSISKHLVTMMGGEIGVESTPGQGSTFWFTIPLRTAVAPTTPAADVAAVAKPASLSGLRVLVAEDNPVNKIIAVKMLSKLGHTAVAVSNGREALGRVQAESFDLILMDCQMPEMDGFEATGKIRALALPSLNALPIIALTANAMTGDRERCLAAGMNDYVSKPMDVSQLSAAIARVCARKNEAA